MRSRASREKPLWVTHSIDWETAEETRAKVIAELNLDPTRNGQEQIELHTKVALKRKQWEEDGLLPDAYYDRIIFIHAKSFLYSLDRIDRMLQRLE
jgi:hypothetical protein